MRNVDLLPRDEVWLAAGGCGNTTYARASCARQKLTVIRPHAAFRPEEE